MDIVKIQTDIYFPTIKYSPLLFWYDILPVKKLTLTFDDLF